jgi:Anti-sigma-K factor rskA, C-terminal
MDLEAQIERLNDVLQHWTATSERHAHAVGELETRLTGWNDFESRLQRDVAWRFKELERLIEQEWASLRRLHEEPARQLREQAESLAEICVNTAGSAQTGVERAEARLAKIEQDLHRRMDELSRDLHVVASQLREQTLATVRGPAGSWSLDAVTRLHQEIRDGSGGPSPERSTPARPVARGGTVLDVNNRRAETEEPQPAERSRWTSYAAIAMLTITAASAGGVAWTFYSKAKLASEQATRAQNRAEEIATAAGERIDAARHDAAAQIAAAHDTAAKAQITGDVLAAPDLIRFSLAGENGGVRASAQVLWSRSRGLVFSASRLPPAPVDHVYEVWLVTTAGDAISAAIVTPDGSGRVTSATDRPPDAPPVSGVRVTLEPAPGSAAPTGPTVLARVQ